MVFQSGALFDSLTVADAADAYPTDLSTGYKRAVAIARALAAQPQCVLYDEPTTMVDPIMSDHLGDLMHRPHREECKRTRLAVYCALMGATSARRLSQ